MGKWACVCVYGSGLVLVVVFFFFCCGLPVVVVVVPVVDGTVVEIGGVIFFW